MHQGFSCSVGESLFLHRPETSVTSYNTLHLLQLSTHSKKLTNILLILDINCYFIVK